MKSLISWFAENHVASNLLMIFVIVSGILTLFTIRVELFPEVTTDKIVVDVEYRGASPQEIEDSIIKPIEERIASLSGIDRIISTARKGKGTVLVEVMEGWNVQELLEDIKTEVDSIATLPKEAERPIIKRIVIKREVVDLALYGDVDRKTLKYWAERVKDYILSLPGITEVDYFGVFPREIHIEIPEKNLRKYGESLSSIARIIRSESMDLPAGRIKNPHEEYLVRVKGKRYYGEEYETIRLFGERRGGAVYLRDIASVKEELRDIIDYAVFYKGHPAVVVEVFRVGNQNVLEISKKVRKHLPYIRSFLPPSIKLEIMRDRTDILWARIKLLLKNMTYGMILVIIALSLFLHLNLAFWVVWGIPTAFSLAIWLMPYFGLSINMISLFAFILVLGIVVDDAIVIGENIFKYREMGEPRRQAAVKGTFEVATPVISSVLTTIAAFWPLLYGVGSMGKFIRVIPSVVILVLTGSLLEALFVLPSHLMWINIPKKKPVLSERLERFVNKIYKPFIEKAINVKWITLSFLTSGLIVVFSLWIGGRIKFTFFPKVEGNRMVCTLKMPAGTPIEETIKVAKLIEEKGVNAVKEVERKRGLNLLEYSLISAGATLPGHTPGSTISVGSHLASIEIRIVDAEKRPGVTTSRLISMWRKAVGSIPGVDSISFTGEIFSFGKAINIALSHPQEDILLEAVEELKKKLSSIKGIYDVEDSHIEGKEELRFRLKKGAKSLGVSLYDIARAVRSSFYGAEALRFQRGEDEISVLVRLPKEERENLEVLKRIRVRLKNGKGIPLLDVAVPYFSTGYVTLERLNRKRVIYVSADVDEGQITGSEARIMLKKRILPRLSKEYPGLTYSFEGEGREEARTMRALKKEFLLALILIYILIAVPLRSFSQPFIIMLAIPFGIVGAFLGHILLGYQLSILSLFGIVGLSGVVVNDAIILVDAINNLRKDKSTKEAVVEACLRRFRPVMLTTITTFFGLFPMVMEKSIQARFLIPMAISLAFGILFATVITLVFVPIGYMVLEDLKSALKSRKEVRLS